MSGLAHVAKVSPGVTLGPFVCLGQPLWSLGTCVHAKLLRLCLTLCNPMDYSPPGSSVHGILQARILEWVAMPSSRDFLNAGIEPASLTSPALVGGFSTTSATWEACYTLAAYLLYIR